MKSSHSPSQSGKRRRVRFARKRSAVLQDASSTERGQANDINKSDSYDGGDGVGNDCPGDTTRHVEQNEADSEIRVEIIHPLLPPASEMTPQEKARIWHLPIDLKLYRACASFMAKNIAMRDELEESANPLSYTNVYARIYATCCVGRLPPVQDSVSLQLWAKKVNDTRRGFERYIVPNVSQHRVKRMKRAVLTVLRLQERIRMQQRSQRIQQEQPTQQQQQQQQQQHQSQQKPRTTQEVERVESSVLSTTTLSRDPNSFRLFNQPQQKDEFIRARYESITRPCTIMALAMAEADAEAVSDDYQEIVVQSGINNTRRSSSVLMISRTRSEPATPSMMPHPNVIRYSRPRSNSFPMLP